MKSIKPGRGPSAMGAVGSVAAAIFGVFWTIATASMGAPTFFVLFGFIFIGLAIAQGIYHYKNATGKNRMSILDITEAHEEPDPLDQYFKGTRMNDINSEIDANQEPKFEYCPFCGNKVIKESYKFCPKCGEEIRS